MFRGLLKQREISLLLNVKIHFSQRKQFLPAELRRDVLLAGDAVPKRSPIAVYHLRAEEQINKQMVLGKYQTDNEFQPDDFRVAAEQQHRMRSNR